jgi:hypothetical protein
MSKKNSPQRLLEDHLKTEHRLQMCRLCIDHKRDFVARLPRMTQNQLQHHLKKGDGPTSGFSGHPICEFCRPKRFYDLNYLHQHLHKEHYKCHICEKQGKDNQWFKNYKSMEKHFDRQHFLCHDVQCLQARFMVFENELDLRAHEMSTHGGTSTGSTKINLEFRTRRAGYDGSGVGEQQEAPSDSDFNFDLDGQAFVPEALPNQGSNTNTTANSASSRSGAQLHPLHVQRTEELRAHAAAVRQQQALEAQGELFPSLQAAAPASGSNAPLVGWTTGTVLQKVNRNGANVGRVTAESFPALPNSAHAEANAKKKAMKGSLGATRRQFAAMSTTASQAPQASWGGGNVASVAAAAMGTTTRPTAPAAASFNRQSNLTADNFPSLGPLAGTRPAPYAAANALSKKNLQRAAAPPSIDSASAFPSMPSANINNRANRNLKPTSAQPPSLNSTIDFPSPPSGSTSAHSAMRQHILGDSKAPAPRTDNVLQVNAPIGSAAKATVEDMKASLGPNKYKQLKRLTKEFATSQLSPEGYVDQSAALFDRGYADTAFWSCFPSLLESCPNQDASTHALRYLTSLRQQVYDNKTRSSRVADAPAAPASQWGGSGASNTNLMRAAAPASSRSNSAPAGRYIPPPSAATSASRLAQSMSTQPGANTFASKKKSAWGGSGNATVVRAKAPPGSVAAAATSQGPQTGSATKFMAKEQKKQPNNSAGNGGGKKKNKQKDELKALAFGK